MFNVRPFPVLRVAFGAAFLTLCAVGLPAQETGPPAADAAAERPLRIIAFGAHPDDAEYHAGGCAAKWAALGHKVKLVSMTNGDIGHWRIAGGALARIRTAETKEVGRRLGGVEVEVLDIHDGELMPTLENRKTVARLIRNWQADVVLCHRPNDYHPDHRNVGLLVRDAAFMVQVPFYVPDSPVVKRPTSFFYYSDRFRRPYPFKPDVAVAIDSVFDRKVQAVDALFSQAYEGGALGSAETLPERGGSDPKARMAWLTHHWQERDGGNADKYRAALRNWYGEERAAAIDYAEVFELCEYGHQPDREELRRLFPFEPVELKPLADAKDDAARE